MKKELKKIDTNINIDELMIICVKLYEKSYTALDIINILDNPKFFNEIITIEKRFDPDSFFYVTREGFVILGWVAIWKPFELILFDWYPVFDKIKLLKKLRDCEIDILYTVKE